MKSVISISRRTDVIAFYSQWLKNALKAEGVEIRAPRGDQRVVSLRPEDVHSLVFWSKNYQPLLEDSEFRNLLEKYDNLYFHFTITGLGSTPAEPRVIPYRQAIKQMENLAEIYGAKRINWRFDPILHWRNSNGEILSNIFMFREIGSGVAIIGVRRCTFSFAQWYGKIPARAAKRAFEYADPSEYVKKTELIKVLREANKLGITLYSCAQDAWAALPGVKKGHCIDGILLSELHPTKLEAPVGKDTRQRRECGCITSTDIGSYKQTCSHGCIYCYASPYVDNDLAH